MPWPKVIPEGAHFYKSLLDEWLALVDQHGLGEHNYYSPDGLIFYQLHQTGYGNGGFSFENPTDHTEGRVSLNKPTVTMKIDGREDEPVFSPTPRPEYTIVIPLPAVRETLYFFRLRDDRFIYVSDDRYDRSNEQIRLFFGQFNYMAQMPIAVISHNCRYEIAGFGLLEVSGRFAKLAGYVLEPLDLQNYIFNETLGKLHVQLKKKTTA